jgi:hypothetical protein
MKRVRARTSYADKTPEAEADDRDVLIRSRWRGFELRHLEFLNARADYEALLREKDQDQA